MAESSPRTRTHPCAVRQFAATWSEGSHAGTREDSAAPVSRKCGSYLCRAFCCPRIHLRTRPAYSSAYQTRASNHHDTPLCSVSRRLQMSAPLARASCHHATLPGIWIRLPSQAPAFVWARRGVVGGAGSSVSVLLDSVGHRTPHKRLETRAYAACSQSCSVAECWCSGQW